MKIENGVFQMRRSVGRLGETDGNRAEEDLRHCERVGERADDDQGIIN